MAVKRRLVVGVPYSSRDDVSMALFRLAFSHAWPDGYEVQLLTAKKGPPDANRNEIAHAFLRHKSNAWLWFVDTDMVPDLSLLRRLVFLAEKHGARVVCPVQHMLYTGLPMPVMGRLLEGSTYQVMVPEGDGELEKTEMVGTGCLLVHRSILEQVPAPWFRFINWGDILPGWLAEELGENDDPEKNGELRMGEDFHFSAKVRSFMGEKMYVAMQETVGHEKKVDLRIFHHMLMQAIGSADEDGFRRAFHEWRDAWERKRESGIL